jgi:hypothetical protein
MRPRRATEHGQYGYAKREKCKCDLCLTAQRRYSKARQYDADTGRPRKIDATPSREHLERLLASGVSVQQIFVATGRKVNKEQIDRIRSGASRKVYRATEGILLAVTREQAVEATYTYVDAVGVRRRIEALRWLGWSLPALAEPLGVSYSAVHLYTQRDRVRTDTVAKIDEVYRRLCNAPGPDERERWRAYRAGFVPPAAWDEDTIDDPEVKPDLSCVRCIVEDCARSVHKMSLCYAHWRKVKEAGALEGASRFKAKVMKLATRQLHDATRVREEVAEMRAAG